MPEIVLNGSRILAIVRKLVAAGMPKHVGMDEERKARGLARSSHHALIASYRKRRSTLRHKDIGAGALGAGINSFPV